MRRIGGGKFIAKDGSTLDISRNLMLPVDVLPGEEELQRDFEAITISHGNENHGVRILTLQ